MRNRNSDPRFDDAGFSCRVHVSPIVKGGEFKPKKQRETEATGKDE